LFKKSFAVTFVDVVFLQHNLMSKAWTIDVHIVAGLA